MTAIICKIQKPDSVQENKTHNLLWDIEIQTNQLIAASSDLVLINQIKKKCYLMNLNPKEKLKDSKKVDEYLELARELNKM